MIQNIFLIGPGNIGTAFLKRVMEKDLEQYNNHRNPSRVIGVANSNHHVFSPEGIHYEQLLQLSNTPEENKSYLEGFGKKHKNLNELFHMVQQSNLREVIFVDTTSLVEPMIDFHKTIIRNGFRIVTANKNPLALCSIENYYLLTQKKGFYEAKTTVMAGNAPWEFIDHKEKIVEPITHICGCINGTMAFTFLEFSKGEKKFSECFRLAHEKGYTEPNPQDDLNGVDSARKLTILTRRAGYLCEYSDVIIEPFLQDALSVSPEKFWKALEKEDEAMEKRRKSAEENGCTLQHIACMNVGEDNNPIMKIGLQEVDKEHPMARLKGTTNCILVETALYSGDNVHQVKSPGAGIEITADSLREGIAEVLPEGSLTH